MPWAAAAAACLALVELVAAGPARLSEPLYQRHFTRIDLQRAARRSGSRLPPAPARPRSVDFAAGGAAQYDSYSEYDSEAALGWFPYLVLAVFVVCAGCLVSYVSVRVAGCMRARRRTGAAGRRRILREQESELFGSIVSVSRSESDQSSSPTDSIEPRSPATCDSTESQSSTERDSTEPQSRVGRGSIEEQPHTARDSSEPR